MTALFADWTGLPPEVKSYLDRLEDFIADVDGKTICMPSDDNTYIDDGTIDADDAVKAINGLVSVIEQERGEVERLRELLRETIPFINDAGNDECPEAQARANDLFVRIADTLGGHGESVPEQEG